METVVKMELERRLNACKVRIASIYDPIDKITEIGHLLKSILETNGVHEVVLATPLDCELKLEEYDTIDLVEYFCEGTDHSFLEYIESRKNGYEVFSWSEPSWIMWNNTETYDESVYYDILSQYNGLNRTIIVRLGIVDGIVKFTCQKILQEEVDDLPGCAVGEPEEQPETDWLKLANIASVNKWLLIAHLLLNNDTIWEYSKKYPQLHKLPL